MKNYSIPICKCLTEQILNRFDFRKFKNYEEYET